MSKTFTPEEKNQVTINRGRINSLTIYEITEDELDKLEKGDTDTIDLNFAIFALSVASSFLITLLTTKIESIKTFNIFLVVVIVGFFSALILLVRWWKNRKNTGLIVSKIKKRIDQAKSPLKII